MKADIWFSISIYFLASKTIFLSYIWGANKKLQNNGKRKQK